MYFSPVFVIGYDGCVTKDIRSNMEEGQVTVLVLLDFSQALDMVVHGLLLSTLKNLQNKSDVGELVSEWLDPVCEMW
jgi:hypothetical protein